MTAVPISILLRARADGREERERRAELAGEVVHAEVGAVGTQLLGGHGQLDRLEQRVRRRAHLRLRRRRPVPERQEPDLLHLHILPFLITNSPHSQFVHRTPRVPIPMCPGSETESEAGK